MSVELTERQMISRFSDGCKRAASAAKDLASTIEIDKPKALVEFTNGLKVAAGSAHQIAIYRENTKFLDIRNVLEMVIAESQDMVVSSVSNSPYWLQIKDFLEGMSVSGQKIADSKPMTRVEVLSDLKSRERAARKDV